MELCTAGDFTELVEKDLNATSNLVQNRRYHTMSYPAGENKDALKRTTEVWNNDNLVKSTGSVAAEQATIQTNGKNIWKRMKSKKEKKQLQPAKQSSQDRRNQGNMLHCAKLF